MLARETILEALPELSSGAAAMTPTELADRVLRLALALIDAEGAVLVTTHNRSCNRSRRLRDAEASELLPAPRDGTRFTRLLSRTPYPFATLDLSHDARASTHDGCPGVDAGPALFIPLKPRDQSPGYLAVYRARNATAFGRDEIRTATLLAASTSLALENRRLGHDLQRLAITDDLTQVYNYRYLKTCLRREIKRATRFKQVLSVVMLDVDNLKAYNDRNGHLARQLPAQGVGRAVRTAGPVVRTCSPSTAATSSPSSCRRPSGRGARSSPSAYATPSRSTRSRCRVPAR